SPAAAHGADDVVRRRTSAVEEHFVELRGPGHLPDGPHVDALLAHRDQQIRQPSVLRRARVRAAKHEAPVGPLRERGPDLLARHDPLAAAKLGARLHVREIAPGVRLGVALAPELVAADDRGQEAALLSIGPEEEDRRSDEPFADMPEPARGPRPRILFEEDHLLVEARAASAVLLRPAEAGPARAAPR